MPRRDNIENLLKSTPSEIAPTVADLKNQAAASSEASTPPPGPGKAASRTGLNPTRDRNPPPPPKQPRSIPRSTGPASSEDSGKQASIRFQVSAPDGSEVEEAMREMLSQVPTYLRTSINIGTLFRQVLVNNDREIADMIRQLAVEGV